MLLSTVTYVKVKKPVLTKELEYFSSCDVWM